MKKIIAKVWQVFKRTPLGKLIRWLAPQWLVNLLEHLPVAVLANMVYGFPSKRIKVIGVTGTDGKTTTVNMIYTALKGAGKKISMVSTINAIIGDKKFDTGFHTTSPHSFYVQEFIKKAVTAGDDYIVLEVTSHALDQHRFFGTKFNIGVITNITHEHLDYHKTFERYRDAKAKLLNNVRWAVLNREDPSFDWFMASKFSGEKSSKVVSFGLKTGDINLRTNPLKLKIPGEFNQANALAASAVARILDVTPGSARDALENFTSLEGRMQEVPNSRGIKVVVDFAHTPNALENALKTLRKLTKGKLISVFGCASERDREKRPMMGKISSQLADVTVLTDEDPRFENPLKIIDEIKKGGKFTEGKDLFVEPDRSKAIKLAISLAKRGDIVGIFGKGHEKSMNYQGRELPWSDVEAAGKSLKDG